MTAKTSLARRSYDFFVRHWIVTALISTLPGWFALVLRYYGRNLGLVGQGDVLTGSGQAVFLLVLAIALCFALAKAWGDREDAQKKNNGHFVLQQLLEGINVVTKAKLKRFESYIHKDPATPRHPFEDITQPEDQIQKLLENIQITLSQIFGIGRDHIGLSIIYRHSDSAEWSWLCKVNVENDLALTPLVSGPRTTAYQVIHGKYGTLFYPDKSVAIANNEYTPGPKDEAVGGNGSIYVTDLSIRQDSKLLMNALLSISTHGHQICAQTDELAQEKVKQLLMPPFVTRLRLELCLFYIRHFIAPKQQQAMISGPVPASA